MDHPPVGHGSGDDTTFEAWYAIVSPGDNTSLASQINQPGFWTPQRRESLRAYNVAMARTEAVKERWRAFYVPGM